MTDPLDTTIRRTLADAPVPEINKFVEKQTLDKALAEFDKKNAAARQGNSGWLRLMGTARSMLQPKDGVSMKTAYKIGGGLAVASLAIMLVNTTSLYNDFVDRGTPRCGHGTAKCISGNGIQVSQGNIPTPPANVPPLPQPPALVVPEVVQPPALVEVPQTLSEKEAYKNSVTDHVLVPSEPVLMETPIAAKPESKDKSANDKVAATAAVPSMMAEVEMIAPPPAPIAAPIADDARKNFAAGAASSMAKSIAGAPMASLSMAPMPPDIIVHPGYHAEGRDKFEHTKENPLKIVKDEPVSTFSIDVDTASYSFMRASLNNNVLPQKDSVRVEEMINYFPYDYALPKDKSAPFANHVTVTPSPWNKGTKLVHIGIKGYDIDRSEKPHSNLVFLVDTSGSMNAPNKLPLVKNSLKLLLDSLEADDTVAIVTYAGSAGVALEPTKVADKQKILSAIDSFYSGGSTAGAEGIRQAYELAERNFDKKGVNRVILATDGDFNVGITNPDELKSFVERKRETGIFLSVLGFGQGNYNDAMMQTLAQNGNGNAAYIDNLNEARKVLVQEAGSTLFTIAKDVKIQVEFNPATVSEYRLIGYETRMLNREDFNNDKIDAGEIGAGHAVTAIYEITPADSEAKLVDDLRYSKEKPVAESKDKGSEYAFLKIRYKLPKEDKSKLITTTIDKKVEVSSLDAASTDARFGVAVAAFGQMLRGASYTQNFSYDDVVNLAQSAKGKDEFGYRAEFINLVRIAKSASGLKPLDGGQRPPTATLPPISLPQPIQPPVLVIP